MILCFLSYVEVIFKLSLVVTIIDLACENKEALPLSYLLSHVPIITVRALEDSSAYKFSMSLRPSYHVTESQALFDVMDFFEFPRVAVVYDGTLILYQIRKTYLIYQIRKTTIFQTPRSELKTQLAAKYF